MACYMLIQTEPKWIKCKQPIFGYLKATVLHFPSGRKAKQTWKLCEEHFAKALSTCDTCGNPEREGWRTIYKKEGKYAEVLNFEIINDVINI